MNRRSVQDKQGTINNRKRTHTAIGKQYAKRDSLNKTISKIGMIGSLGSLLVSGFIRFKGAKTLHVWSGVAFLGFSMWHYMQNRSQTKNT